jgi:hypothetical protein
MPCRLRFRKSAPGSTFETQRFVAYPLATNVVSSVRVVAQSQKSLLLATAGGNSHGAVRLLLSSENFSSGIAVSITASSVFVRWLAVVASAAALTACGSSGSSNSGGGSGTPPADTVTLGGTISGLSASGLVLANNGATVAVGSGATTFAFSASITTGSTYAVTVQSAPSGQTCSVANGTGTAGTADINNVVVTCATMSFTVGGSIAGLNVGGLVLADNGADLLTVPSGATSFTMPTAVASTSGYAITVATQPTGLSCGRVLR